MIKVTDLSKNYGTVEAVKSISFNIQDGEIVGVLGANGAGKSSTLMSIAGHVKIQEGKVFYKNNELNQIAVHNRIRLGIALVPEGRRLFPDLSVEENLKIGAYHKSKQRYSTNLEKVFELFPRLKDRIGQLAGSLSGGEQQMLAIGRALMAEPSLLLIDELSLGLMPKIIDQCYEVIQELKKQGMTLLIVEQNTKKAFEVSDQVLILESGRKVWEGKAEDAKNNPEIFEAYLGLSS